MPKRNTLWDSRTCECGQRFRSIPDLAKHRARAGHHTSSDSVVPADWLDPQTRAEWPDSAPTQTGGMTPATHLQTAIRMLSEQIAAAEKRIADLKNAEDDLARLRAQHAALLKAQSEMERPTSSLQEEVRASERTRDKILGIKHTRAEMEVSHGTSA